MPAQPRQAVPRGGGGTVGGGQARAGATGGAAARASPMEAARPAAHHLPPRSWAQAAAAATTGTRGTLATPPATVHLRPGGGTATAAPRPNNPGGSSAAGPAPPPRDGRTGAVGEQRQGPPMAGAVQGARTVSVAEAAKGAAEADGFIEVKPMARQRNGADTRGQHPGGGTEGGAAASGTLEQEGGGGGHAEEQQGDDDQQPPNEDVLRSYWEAAKDLLAFAKKQGYPEDHPVRRNAQQQVDAAFADWRAATPPKAVHARMGWAEEALRRARRAQARAEQELDDLDRQYEADREIKVRALDEARERTKERVQKLADLSQEAADEYCGGIDGGGAESLLRGTFRTLDAQVGPAVESLLAKLDEGSEQYDIVHQVLQSVTTMHAALGIATGGSAADFFDMAAEDGDGAATGQGATPVGPPACSNGAEGSQAMDTADVRAPRWMEPKRGGEPDPASSTGAQPPRWKKCRAAGGSDGHPPTAAAERAGADAAGATATAGTARCDAGDGGGAAPPTPTGDPQQDEFEPRRRQVIAQAEFDGIDVPADYLRQLCPEALEEWAREHLL